MKIGDFAKKYGMNITAVRYYVERALLTPERRNNQYVFDRSCMDDMEKILKYKSFRLSLEEIELLFFLEKASRFRDDTIIDICAEVLSRKKDELEEEAREICSVVDELEREIGKFDSIRCGGSSEDEGIPFSFIPYLYCPCCHEPLSLENASISNNRILSGQLMCGCGYTASIDDGIIMAGGHSMSTPFRAFENIESVASITEELGKEYRLLIDRTYMWMYHQLPKDTEHSIVMAGPFTFNFLLKYSQKFSKGTTFVVNDPSVKRLRKMRDYLGGSGYGLVLVASDLENIPLRNECIDIYIDDYSSTNCLFTYNDTQYGAVAPMMRRKGMAVGIFTDYARAPESLRAYREDHPDFIPERLTAGHIRADIAAGGMKLKGGKELGDTAGREKQFKRQKDGEIISVKGYKAVKG